MKRNTSKSVPARTEVSPLCNRRHHQLISSEKHHDSYHGGPDYQPQPLKKAQTSSVFPSAVAKRSYRVPRSFQKLFNQPWMSLLNDFSHLESPKYTKAIICTGELPTTTSCPFLVSTVQIRSSELLPAFPGSCIGNSPENLVKISGFSWNFAKVMLIHLSLVTYPIYKKSLSKFDNFQRHQKTDWNKVVVQDYKCQQIVSKVDRQHSCGPKDTSHHTDGRNLSDTI